MKKKFGEYYIGLDIGTDSIGYAVTDLDYKIQKLNGKAMWGIRLFEAGKTAEERRLHRIARRLNDRKKQRLSLLRDLFTEEINKVDPNFFQRLKDSKFVIDDKNIFQPYALFNDKSGMTDKTYYQQYPTIYHLRKALIESNQKDDIRLIYLASHHIIKHRGHFLLSVKDSDTRIDFIDYYQSLAYVLSEELDIHLELNDDEINQLKELLSNIEISNSDKQRQLIKLLSFSTNQEKEIAKFLAGNMGKLSVLYQDELLKDSDFEKLKFSESKYEENVDAIANLLEERMKVISVLKSLYDWSVLQDILHDYDYMSFAKVANYDEHKRDLADLKRVFKLYLSKLDYKNFFSDNKVNDNYVAYIGATNKVGKKLKTEKRCSQDAICKAVKKLLEPIKDNDALTAAVYQKADSGRLLPKQKIKDNSVIPNQIHKIELERILENAAKHYDFLNQMDEQNGLTVAEKILSILTFRIPYYVGPLNPAHSVDGKTKQSDGSHHAWIKKRAGFEHTKIYPWNFDKVVDVEASAERFILNMTNQCSYLAGEDVLPKNSLLYSEYMVRNEINNLKVNGQKLEAQLKDAIFEDLFKKQKRVSVKKIKDYLVSNGHVAADDQITGIDISVKSSLKSYHAFVEKLGKDFVINHKPQIEDIIRYITLFGDDAKLLRKRLKKHYGNLMSDTQIKDIAKLKFTGWARLSEKLLTGIHHTTAENGIEQHINIISAMRIYGDNLMELLSRRYQFSEQINAHNKAMQGNAAALSYKLVDDLYVSPALKRGIWQTLLIVKELVKIMGRQPKRIFIEMARGPEEKKRTHSRKQKLIDLYKSIKTDKDWAAEIADHSDAEMRSKKLYLYYLQMGKCMYTGQTIDLHDLLNRNSKYDIDHIFPRSKVKDDSFDNLVLVDKNSNAYKSDDYPIGQEIRKARFGLWKSLLDRGLLTQKKFNRLTRNTSLSAEELADFVARQLVETRQSTKAVAGLLGNLYQDSEIVYVKAANVSKFRQDNDMIKVRAVNDLHHAKDAYLNIVVGNVYHTKFTKNPKLIFSRVLDQKEKLSLNHMFSYPVERDGVVAWQMGKDGSLHMVKQMMKKNNIQFTRYAYTVSGGFYDQMPLKKGKGQFPLKTGDMRLSNIARYGGYNKVSGAYFCLVKHMVKNKQVLTLEAIPVIYAQQFETDRLFRESYLTEVLKLNNPNLVIKKIKFNALFDINNMKVHITGRSGKDLLFKHAHQLILDYKWQLYIKRIDQMIVRAAAPDELVKKEIDAEKNIELYDIFISKLMKKCYFTKLRAQYKTLNELRDNFIEVSLDNQIKTLMQILKFFKCDRELTNLQLIQGVPNAGKISFSKNIHKNNSAYLIHQSITGLFEQKIDLLKL